MEGNMLFTQLVNEYLALNQLPAIDNTTRALSVTAPNGVDINIGYLPKEEAVLLVGYCPIKANDPQTVQQLLMANFAFREGGFGAWGITPGDGTIAFSVKQLVQGMTLTAFNNSVSHIINRIDALVEKIQTISTASNDESAPTQSALINPGLMV